MPVTGRIITKNDNKMITKAAQEAESLHFLSSLWYNGSVITNIITAPSAEFKNLYRPHINNPPKKRRTNIENQFFLFCCVSPKKVMVKSNVLLCFVLYKYMLHIFLRKVVMRKMHIYLYRALQIRWI